MPKKRIFKILSIDGGGILGVYSADILKRIQDEFCKGGALSDEFQLITGTSTGGIIALALAFGKEPAEIVEFYTQYAQKIFPNWRGIIFWGGLFHNKYSNRRLHKVLEEFFKDSTIADCKTAVCIPAIDVSNCQPMIFKTNNNGTQKRDLTVKLKDIALATSAAPTYFPIYAFGEYRGLMDGGLWQNNPALCGVIEACSYFVGEDKEYEKIRILSVGNPLSGVRQSVSLKNKSTGVLKLRDKLVLLPMKTSTIGTHQILNFLAKTHALSIESYVRIETENLATDFRNLRLDSSDDESIKKMLELSSYDFNHKKSELIPFFKEEK
jgi:patatin-like phospholipase/acyl hydrolase